MSATPDWIPEPDESSAPFFEGAQAGKLMLQRCDDCKSWHYPVRVRCSDCGSTAIRWAEASGRGRVYSHGLLRRAYHPRHRDQLPIVMAVIDLEEGVRMHSNLSDVEPDGVEVGMEVAVAFESTPAGKKLPVFRPA